MFICISVLNPNIKIPSRDELRKKTIQIFGEFKATLASELKKIEYVCMTADCWTSKNKKRFMGVTAHWLDKNLTRKSAVLAPRRFPGDHSYEAIANLLFTIMKEFDLDTAKIVSVVTDDGSNFVKAFEQLNIIKSAFDNQIGGDDEEDDVIHEEIFNVMQNEDSCQLPNHSR